MLYRCALALLLATSTTPSYAQELPAPMPRQLPEQGYVWMPQLSPQGPTTIVVSLEEQRAYVYRNGVRIGVTKVSTGKVGHETPTGVFTILEKHREHYSNRYDNAPMPFMQRLTWDGVALHAGNVPAYPASHGCIRLPYAFSETLFQFTTRGTTVIVNNAAPTATVVYPGLFAADVGFSAPTVPAEPFRWVPGRSASGPITLVLSSRDREIVVLRNAIEIGRAPIAMTDGLLQGTRVYLLLEGAGPDASIVVPGRPALRWLAVSLEGTPETPQQDLRQWVASGQLRIDPDFASRVYEVLTPGSSLVVTDEAIRPGPSTNATILKADQGGPEEALRPAP